MIETERLILRGWRPEDAAAHHTVCSDPRVAATLGTPPSPGDSQAVVQRQNDLLARLGHCFWALEDRATGLFVGWCGLKPGVAPIDGEMEIGWTLAPEHWGRGLAFEAASACVDWAWVRTDTPAIAAITSSGNVASARLMARLGMTRVVDGDFDHPDLIEGDPLRRHVLYRISRP